MSNLTYLQRLQQERDIAFAWMHQIRSTREKILAGTDQDRPHNVLMSSQFNAATAYFGIIDVRFGFLSKRPYDLDNHELPKAHDGPLNDQLTHRIMQFLNFMEDHGLRDIPPEHECFLKIQMACLGTLSGITDAILLLGYTSQDVGPTSP